MSTTEKILLIILGVLILAYIFVYFYGSYPVHNDGSVEVNGRINNSYSNNGINNQNMLMNQANMDDQEVVLLNNQQNMPVMTSMQEMPVTEQTMIPGEYLRNNDYAPPVSANSYIDSSFAKGVRGNYIGSADIDAYFDQNNNVIRNAFMDKPVVTGVDETNGQYGTFFPTKTPCSSYDNQDCDRNDLYNPDNYLPQQNIPSWFDAGSEPVAVKDRNLVNISRTMAINTTMGNKKNMSQDLRGGINNPRAIVGPWNQAVIEPGDDYHRL